MITPLTDDMLTTGSVIGKHIVLQGMMSGAVYSGTAHEICKDDIGLFISTMSGNRKRHDMRRPVLAVCDTSAEASQLAAEIDDMFTATKRAIEQHEAMAWISHRGRVQRLIAARNGSA